VLLLCLFDLGQIWQAYFNHAIVLAYWSAAVVGYEICYFHVIALAGLPAAYR